MALPVHSLPPQGSMALPVHSLPPQGCREHFAKHYHKLPHLERRCSGRNGQLHPEGNPRLLPAGPGECPQDTDTVCNCMEAPGYRKAGMQSTCIVIEVPLPLPVHTICAFNDHNLLTTSPCHQDLVPSGGQVLHPSLHLVEGCALVFLCNYRAQTKRISLTLLKETRLLMEVLKGSNKVWLQRFLVCVCVCVCVRACVHACVRV